MVDTALRLLLDSTNEQLEVDFKDWIDLSDNASKAKLARHLAALSNHGGGYLVFGIDDKTRQVVGANPFDLKTYNQDTFSSIIKRYLEPAFQVEIEIITRDGIDHAIVIVPPHGPRPVIAISDGPQINNKVVGINSGVIYVRSAGPESAAIRTADDWTALLERCLAYRTDLLGKLFRQTLSTGAPPKPRVSELLNIAMTDTSKDFVAQIENLGSKVEKQYQESVKGIGSAFAAIGYALVDADGNFIEITNPRSLNVRASHGMHKYASYGWTAFLSLDAEQLTPQTRMTKLGEIETTYVEGMRITDKNYITSTFDYWRFYQSGMAINTENYREDADWGQQQTLRDREPHISFRWALIKYHSVLAHARLIGEMTPGVSKIILNSQWRGLSNRTMRVGDMDYLRAAPARENHFRNSLTLDWAEVRDTYALALRRALLPFLIFFPPTSLEEPDEWLTVDLMKRAFGQLDRRLGLFDD